MVHEHDKINNKTSQNISLNITCILCIRKKVKDKIIRVINKYGKITKNTNENINNKC
jgi:hypothetical protein